MLATIKIDLPQELATRLQPVEDQLPRILELGLRELNAITRPAFAGAADILEFLASLPEPEEIVALRPSKALEDRVRDLLEKNRTVGLTLDEQREWEQYEYLEHLVRRAKARAYLENGVRSCLLQENGVRSCLLPNSEAS